MKSSVKKSQLGQSVFLAGLMVITSAGVVGLMALQAGGL